MQVNRVAPLIAGVNNPYTAKKVGSAASRNQQERAHAHHERAKSQKSESKSASTGTVNESSLYSIQEEIQTEHDGVYKIRISNFLHTQLTVAEFCSLFFAMLGLVLSIILYEFKKISDQEDSDFQISNDVRTTVLTYNLICTILLVFSNYARYEIWLEWSTSVNMFTRLDTLVNTGLWKYMAFEMLINAMAPYPFLDGVKYTEYVEAFDTTISYEVNDILLFFCFNRLYLCIKFVLYLTQFKNPRAQRICSMNGCEASSMFAVKALMKQKPYEILFGSLFITTIIFGFQLRLFEGVISDVSGQNFENMWNCMWNVVITLTSVGYGELYPKTFFGRIVGIIICFWGVFIVSFFVVTVTNMLNFTSMEEKSYNLIIKLLLKQELKKEAVDVLSSAFNHRNCKLYDPKNESKQLSTFRNFRSDLLIFQQKAKELKNADFEFSHGNEQDATQNIVTVLLEQIKDLKGTQIVTIENVNQILSTMEDQQSRKQQSDSVYRQQAAALAGFERQSEEQQRALKNIIQEQKNQSALFAKIQKMQNSLSQLAGAHAAGAHSESDSEGGDSTERGHLRKRKVQNEGGQASGSRQSEPEEAGDEITKIDVKNE